MENNKQKVLIVDDDPKICSMFKEVIEEEGFIADFVTNGSEAVEMVRAGGYSVVLMDVIMPGMNGVEALENIRKFDEKVKVVMVTGYSVGEMLEKAKQFGAYVSLTKPINMSKLIEVINEKVHKDEYLKKELRRCLVIDEKSTIEVLLYSILESSGFYVKIYNDSRDAVKNEDLDSFSIIMLNVDPNDPKSPESLKRFAGFKDKVVVLVDTSEEESLMEKAFGLDAQKYINSSDLQKGIMDVLKGLK